MALVADNDELWKRGERRVDSEGFEFANDFDQIPTMLYEGVSDELSSEVGTLTTEGRWVVSRALLVADSAARAFEIHVLCVRRRAAGAFRKIKVVVRHVL